LKTTSKSISTTTPSTISIIPSISSRLKMGRQCSHCIWWT
jgi:hypothetical protein